MNAGKWIFVAFVFFAGFIATLVTICVRQDISLVSKDYYKNELAYSEQITQINNTNTLTEKPLMKIVGDSLVVRFPRSATPSSGELLLFCPSDERGDKTFEIKNTIEQRFMVSGLNHGMYKARLSWTAGSTQFFQEQIINL